MRQQEDQLKERNIQVKVVTFDDAAMARAYIADTHLTWPLLLDQKLSLYSAYGMVRGSWWSIYGPKSVWKYISLMVRGQKPGTPGKDWRQLGGDVLVDPNRIVQLHHISEGPHDRPSVDALLEVVDKQTAFTRSP